jgi:cytochrome c peroxidase
MRRLIYGFAAFGLVMLLFAVEQVSSARAQDLDPQPDGMIALGKAIFFDTHLSINGTQSCASCHAPEVGFTGPDMAANSGGAIYQGALPNHFGNRKPPASAYAGDSPILHFDQADGGWFGGMFYDGRATGSVLGDPLAEQAQGPFLNPLEQGIAEAQVLCVRVKQSDYAGLFEEVWGAKSLDCAKDVDGVYEKIGRSVAAYERSAEVNPFTSKFDLFWDNAVKAGKDVTKIKCGTGGMGGGGMGGVMGCPGGGTSPYRWSAYRNLGLADVELQGLAVFNDPARANCSSCHSLEPGSDGYPLFTDFGYDNIGIPKNPENPFYSMPAAWNPDGADWVDEGLGGFLKSAGYESTVYEPELGKFKVPTLRNVDLRPSEGFVKAYGHNGYFKSLDDIVFFYHWRGMMDNGCMGMGGGGGMGSGMGCEGMAGMFPAPEVDQNRASLGMFPMPQIENIVAFLKTLSDGYFQR